ncbi:MAG TPA: ABC transporter ATP-binding protein [Candidatus Azoamicus sp. OHIO2]
MVKINYLELEHISFSYKKNNTILTNINIKIESGKIIALLGINGSGKTTLLKILTGIYKPTSGYIKYNNEQITSKNIMQYKAVLGFMPEFLFLYKNMTVQEILLLLASLKGYDNYDITDTLKTVFLLEHRNKQIKALSKGMKQRLNLAQAIIGNPKIILFDEPSNGFDCGSIAMFYHILKNLTTMGAIVLISSHHLTEIYNNVDQVLILSNGTIIKHININTIDYTNEILYKELILKLDDSLDKTTINLLKNDFPSIIIDNETFTLLLKVNTKTLIKLITSLITLNIKINDIRLNNKILEEILTTLS